MKKTFKENLLVQLKGNMQVNSEKKNKRNNIGGEMKLQIVEKNDKSICIKLNKLGWYGLGFDGKDKNTGKISGMAQFGKSVVQQTKRGLSFEIRTTSEVVYKAIEDELGVTWINDHMSTVPGEIFETVVTGRFDTARSSKSNIRYKLRDLEIALHYVEGGIKQIDTLQYYDKNPTTFLLAGSTNTDLSNLGNCHPDLETNERTLTVQPVGFRSSAGDPLPSGQSIGTQMAAASTIWGKCCINFNVLPIHLITDATLKTSSNINNIRASYTSPNANAIEVFVVDNNLTAQGGGVANACNSLLGNIVMSDNNAGNPQLLSHELGHILGLGHPGTTFTGCTTPDANTVMAPSGSPSVPNSTNNTHWNCINVANPGLTTSTTTCCLSHDIPNTILKDFPEDAGTEPNPGFAGRNFYSMSNVWNRLANAAGGLNPDGTPDHEHPARFEMDGVTLHTNYLFAKVNVLANLNVRSPEVRFYMKHPGAGGGAANLQLLGTAPITGTLAMGSPQTVSLPWTVPSGTPGHSCVFAVVHTPAEPGEDITALNWTQTEQLIRDDNDWAQRNLDIENTLTNLGNLAEHKISFAPIVIDYPREKGLKEVPLSVKVHMSGNKEVFDHVELIFPAMDLCIPVQPGENVEIDVTQSLRPASKVLMIARAKLNDSKISLGDVIETIGITPVLGGDEIVGYGFSMKTGKSSNAINQLIDRMQAGLHDLGEISAWPELACLCELMRKLRRGGCNSATSIVDAMREKIDTLKALQKKLKRDTKKAYQFADMEYAFDKFYRYMDDQGNEARLFDAVRDLINRFEIFTWFVYLDYKIPPLAADEGC